MNMVTQVIEGQLPDIFQEELSNPYQKEWDLLFCTKYYLDKLKSLAIKGDLKKHHFRSICWKVFLNCLPENKSLWIEAVHLHRKQYDVILDKFDTNPRTTDSLDINVNNPLSQSQQSPWNQYFEDAELKVTIEQDVVRTFPEIEFFHEEHIQKMMTSILFSYAREFPDISYKQGMHEILAPILFVLMCDVNAYLEYSKENKLDSDLHIMLNQNYIEHDAFVMFRQLMTSVEAWYTSNDYPYFNKVSAFPSNRLGQQLKRIYEQLLKRHDNKLFLRLEELEITPQIFGIRWLRLLFGREFSMPDLLVIWDALFADSIKLDLVDFIFVGMLISIRDLLLSSDYASCLTHLMRFPNVADVHYIIRLALHLREPSNYIKPSGKVLNPLSSRTIKDNNRLAMLGGISKASSEKSQTLKKRPSSFTTALPTAGKISSIKNREKSSSLVESLIRDPSTEQIDSDNFYSEYCDKRIASIENQSSYPRTMISNVMECKNHANQASKIINDEGYRKSNDKSDPLDREMVPLSRSHSTVAKDIKHEDGKITPEDAPFIRDLQADISDLKMRMDYCSRQITLHLSKLQESITMKELLHHDEMCLAVAGLKRARDILRGNVSFSEDVIKEDIDLYSGISESNNSKNLSTSTNSLISKDTQSQKNEQSSSDEYSLDSNFDSEKVVKINCNVSSNSQCSMSNSIEVEKSQQENNYNTSSNSIKCFEN